MTDISFYHLTRQGLDVALPRLLEKVLEAGLRAVVRVGSDERLKDLDAALWTYDPDSFLAHGTAATGFADKQPVYLTTAEENPNGSEVLVLTDGMEAPDIGDFQRCLYMFDGRSEALTDQARAHWKTFQSAGHATTYWQQGEQGGWQKKADAASA